MKPLLYSLFALLISLHGSLWGAPLRVLVSSDVGEFSADYAATLKAGGATVVVAESPTAEQLGQADVLLLHRSQFAPFSAEQQAALSGFTQKGGGVVAVHGAMAGGDLAWGKAIYGGAWDPQQSERFSSTMMLYVRTDADPIVRGSSSFDLVDETLYDLALDEKIFVLGSAFTPKVTNSRKTKPAAAEQGRAKAERASIYDLQPQIWSFQGEKHRAVALLQGSPASLKHPSIRTFILRGVAWAGKREEVNAFCSKADLATLRYPLGGPLRPADAIKAFQMQPGFKASVVAAEPLISKPIAVQWDGRGRMWVAETPEYPNGRRPLTADAWKEGGVLDPGHYDRPARDTISVLVDTDGDGVMDKKTIFHEGLELITGFCMYRDGVIVVSQPNILWLRDTDGDGKADKEVILYGGFAAGDTHFIANHFIAAPDGWIYASSGGGGTATKGGMGEVMAKISSGIFRFKADGSAIEQVASQGGNSFGAEVTSDMEIFHGKATNGNPLQHVVLPEGILARSGTNGGKSMSSVNPGRPVARKDLPDRAPLMQIDQVGRYSAACASMVYEGGAWPAEYNGLIFCSEPILDIIHHERLVPVGPTFSGELFLKDSEWLRSMDHFFCPIDLTFGPDGAMVVLDFYTPVVAHNDTRGPQHSKSGASVRPDREHYFGRIYRIQHDAAPKLSHPDLTVADSLALVGAFTHPNRVVRWNAIRILLEKADTLGGAAVPALTTMATTEKFVPARILALWALQRLGKMTPAVLTAALTAADTGVRKNALLIVESGRTALPPKEMIAAINDSDARVRLTALRALGAVAISPEVALALSNLQPTLDDPWSKSAAIAATLANPLAQIERLLVDPKVATGKEDLARSLVGSLVASNDPAAILRVLEVAEKSASLSLAGLVVGELAQRPLPKPSDQTVAQRVLKSLLGSPNRSLAAAVLPIVVQWDTTATFKAEIAKEVAELFTLVKDPSLPLPERQFAIRSLLAARAGDPAILLGVIALLTQAQPDPLRRELIVALAKTNEESAGRALAKAFPGLPVMIHDAAFDALVGRPAWTGFLLDTLEAKEMSPTILGPAKISRLTAHPNGGTSKRAKELFAQIGGGTNPAKDEIISKLLLVVDKPGDPVKGKTLFTASCATCHRLGGEGNQFGPDLDGIGSHPVAELLMHIVDPSRMVDDEHRTWNITMKDGTIYSALIASENTAIVTLRQPGGVSIPVKVTEISSRVKAANSLMPEGLEALGAETLRDIIAYIQSVAPKAVPAPQKAPTKAAVTPKTRLRLAGK